MIGKTNR